MKSGISIDEDRVRELILKALDGDASDDELRGLNEVLLENEQVRTSAARFLCDDSLLAEEIGTIEEATTVLSQLVETNGRSSGLGELLDLRIQHAVSSRPHLAVGTSTILRPIGTVLGFINRHGLAVAAAAALLALAFLWQHWALMARFDKLYSIAAVPDPVARDEIRDKSRESNIAPGVASVARVTGLSDCKWPTGEEPLKFGDQLAPGQRLHLTKGVLQLTFNTGARVVVEGPVDFELTAPSEATLTAGKVAAAVPRFARGYTILTPSAEVVDLGTEFGVDVDKTGASEVHVFEGDVVARSRANGVSSGELIHARVDEGIHFDLSAKGGRRIKADTERFVRRLTPKLGRGELPSLPVTDNLALWLAADVMPGVELKQDAPIPLWPDLLIGDNRFPDDACQFDPRMCPTWIRDDRDLPAVRFDGWSSYLVTSPMATGHQQTVFVVCAPSPASFASKMHGGILFKDGLSAPSLELTILTDRSPRGWVWAQNDDGSTANVGIVKGQSLAPQIPCAISYTYDSLSNQAELVVNGKSVGTSTAPKSIEQNAKRYIGSHAQPWYEAYFLGNMYEIIVFDTALNSSNRDRVFQYLSTRYGIALGN
jgi:Concanavalin A-like lectin/glucanases superfamily/FecR protein